MDSEVQFHEEQFAARRTEARPARSLTGWMIANGLADSERGANAILLVCAIALLIIAGGVLLLSSGILTNAARAGIHTPSPEIQAQLHAMHAVGY
jgi:hypothetical protein